MNECSTAETIVDQIRSLSQLEYDWNSYGAKPIDPDIIEAAIRLVEGTPAVQLVSPPAVVPCGGGGLQLEWHWDKQSLELEFTSADWICYCAFDDDKGTEETAHFSPTDKKRVTELLQWFIGAAN